ncbi:MAG: SUMF1/EgtB/PvdO family nonheme iron enzyme [Armatimonadota bacterium]|nr:SUMF1/EgtB/PvdO family nonheme iron enzyme [Armatimonadota bacterium]
MKALVFVVMAVLALLCLGGIAQADVFNMPPGLTNLETVGVGNAGNAADATGYGSVSYNYNIGKYEVTATQYTEFLNAKAATDPYGLYNTSMWSDSYYGCKIQRSGSSGGYTYSVASDYANRPVNYVSYWDSLRFANWLGNGQGNGDTENGAYTLTPTGIANNTITRNAGWKWAVTSEDEWYKAAYYKGGSANAGYWLYPTKSNTSPANQVLPTDPGNSANYYVGGYSIGSPYYRTNVGEFENSASAYGTFDQGGNVWEWNEAMTGAYRCLRGGSFYTDGGYYLQASSRYNDYPTDEDTGVIGFRVSEVVHAYGINNRAASDPIMSTASARFNFRVWGKVTILVSGNSFTVDDGSGMPVKVVAPGFSGIQDEDYACALGAFSGEGSNRVLNAQASDVVKLQ